MMYALKCLQRGLQSLDKELNSLKEARDFEPFLEPSGRATCGGLAREDPRLAEGAKSSGPQIFNMLSRYMLA